MNLRYAKEESTHSKKTNEKAFFETLLHSAGIELNGPNPWDIQVHDSRLFKRALQEQSLGLGEAYMDGWWDCAQLDEFFHRLLRSQVDQQLFQIILSNKRFWFFGLKWLGRYLQTKLLNDTRRSKAYKIGEAHYDLGNDLFQSMLDSEMNYSCGYWRDADSLEQAQQAKMQLICEKMKLEPGQRLLDIGCGWGGLARFAAKHYGVKAVGITVSREQKAWADERNQGLPIEIRLQDYRDLDETFDHVVSVGMFEHVGSKNYATFMNVVQRVLSEKGLFLLHTIGRSVTTKVPDPWIKKYIFPQGLIPSVTQVSHAIEKRFVMEDWHNFGANYDKTLMAWYQNFETHWPELKKHYNDRFYRMWRYYLLACAGAFRARSLQLWQIVLSKNGVPQGYQSIR